VFQTQYDLAIFVVYFIAHGALDWVVVAFFSKQTLGRVQTYSEDGISADCYVPVKFQYAQDKKWFSVMNTSQLAS
jgi:hypothetical protein